MFIGSYKTKSDTFVGSIEPIDLIRFLKHYDSFKKLEKKNPMDLHLFFHTSNINGKFINITNKFVFSNQTK